MEDLEETPESHYRAPSYGGGWGRLLFFKPQIRKGFACQPMAGEGLPPFPPFPQNPIQNLVTEDLLRYVLLHYLRQL